MERDAGGEDLIFPGAAPALAHEAQRWLAHLRADPQADLRRYAIGALLTLGAVACCGRRTSGAC